MFALSSTFQVERIPKKMYKLRNTKCKYCDVYIPQLNGTRRNVCRLCFDQRSRGHIIGFSMTDIDMKCTKTIHYCKADKKSGKPVVVTDYAKSAKGNVKNVSKWHMDLFDEHGYPVRIEVEFNNTEGRAKRSGATTMLKVMETESWV